MDQALESVRIIEYKYLRGPNVWNRDPCLEVLVDIGEFENYPSNKIPYLSENIKKNIPSLYNHRCNYNVDDGFFRKLDEGTYYGHILEHISIELLNFTNYNRSSGRTRGIEDRGVYKVAFRIGYISPEVAKKCFEFAVEILALCVRGDDVEISKYQEEIEKISNADYNDQFLNPILFSIPIENEQPEIPYFYITDGQLFQLGYGKNQVNLMDYYSSKSSGISNSIVNNKEPMKRFLSNQAIPVVESFFASSMEELKDIMSKMSFPMVLKPVNGLLRRGISYLKSDKDIKKYYDYANKYTMVCPIENEKKYEVCLEKYVDGDSFKVLIINYNFVSCSKVSYINVNTTIVGDGNSTIEELLKEYDAHYFLKNQRSNKKMIDEYNDRNFIKNRYCDHDFTLSSLYSLGFKLDSVLNKNTKITFQRRYKKPVCFCENLNKETIKKCILAAKILDSEVCELNLLIKNPKESMDNGNGYVLTVSYKPDLYFYHNLSKQITDKRNKDEMKGMIECPGKIILDFLFDDNLNGIIPILAITGNGNRKLVNSIVRNYFISINQYVCSSGDEGSFINNKKIMKIGKTKNDCVKDMFINRNTEMAIVDYSSKEIANEGVLITTSNTLVLGMINQSPECSHDVFCCYKNEPEYNIKILKVLLGNVPVNGYAILNGDDRNIKQLEEFVLGKIIYYTTKEITGLNPTVYEHIVSGEKAVIIQNNSICLHEKISIPIIDLKNLNQNIDIVSLIASIAAIWSYADLILDNKNLNSYMRKFLNK